MDYGSSECLNEQKENNYKNVFVKSEEESKSSGFKKFSQILKKYKILLSLKINQ